METFSVLLTLCEGNSPVTGEILSQRPVAQSFDVFFDMRPNKRWSKLSRRWWFETLVIWDVHYDVIVMCIPKYAKSRNSQNNSMSLNYKVWIFERFCNISDNLEYHQPNTHSCVVDESMAQSDLMPKRDLYQCWSTDLRIIRNNINSSVPRAAYMR